MKNLIIFSLSAFVLVFSSCGKSDKKLAEEKLVLAGHFYEQGDTLIALSEIDSISFLYPEAFQVIAKAKTLQKRIYSEMLYRIQDELDSVKIQITDLEKKFIAEKTEYDRFTQYIYKRQNFDRRWNKSFIQFHVDERGELYMSSNYYGDQRLNHTGIRVYDGDLEAKTKTVSLDSPDNHRSDFMDAYWEKVSYRKGKDNGVIQFIAKNSDRRLKAVFLGKRYYYIILEDYDKDAAKDVIALSQLLQRRSSIEKQINELQFKVR